MMSTGRRDMANESGDKLLRGESHELDAGSVLVLVAHEKIVWTLPCETAIRHRSAPDVVAQILNNAATMLVCGHDLDVPGLLSDGVDQFGALFLGEIAGKLEFSRNDVFCQERNELATELRPDDAGWEKKAVSCFDPLPVWRESSAGNEKMNMRMNPDRLAPTVECCDDSRQGSEMLRICQQFLQTLPGRLE